MDKNATYIVTGCTGYVGNVLAKKLMDEAKANDPSERMEGRLEVWSERHAEIVREGAEVKAMLDCLK